MPGFGIRDSGFGIRGSGFDSRFEDARIQGFGDEGFRIRD
jgi:hypothetical protein